MQILDARYRVSTNPVFRREVSRLYDLVFRREVSRIYDLVFRREVSRLYNAYLAKGLISCPQNSPASNLKWPAMAIIPALSVQ